MRRKPLMVGIILSCVASIGVGAVLLHIMNRDAQERASTPPEIKIDPEWLMEPTANISYTITQVAMLLENNDPNRGQMGIVQQLRMARALEFAAAASEAVRDAGDDCFKKDLDCYYARQEKYLLKSWANQETVSGKTTVVFDYYALLVAQHGSLQTPQSVDELFARVVERARQDTNLAEQYSLNGIAGQAIKQDAQLQNPQ